MDTETTIFGGLVAVVALFLLLMISYCTVGMKTEEQCKSRGYKEASLTWNFNQYCHREENEYEITIPLEEVQ